MCDTGTVYSGYHSQNDSLPRLASDKTYSGSNALRWAVLGVALLAYVAWAFSFLVMSPSLPAVVGDLRISETEGGLLMSAVMIPGIILSIPMGVIAGRFGVRLTGSIALMCLVLSSFITATAPSYEVLLAARILLGIGGTIILIVTPTLVAQWFDEKELGRAMGIYAINMPLATIIAFPVGSALVLASGWRYPFYVSLVLGTVTLILYSIVARGGPMPGRIGDMGKESGWLSNHEIWKVGIVWLLFNGAALSFSTWAPTLFSTYKGFPQIEAGSIPSISATVVLFFIPAFGLMSDRIGKRKLFVAAGASGISLALVAMAFASGILIIPLVIAMGFSLSMIPAVVQLLPAEMLGPKMAGVGFAVLGICFNIGVATTSPLIGMILDTTNSYSLSLLSMAVLAVMASVVASSLKSR